MRPCSVCRPAAHECLCTLQGAIRDVQRRAGRCSSWRDSRQQGVERHESSHTFSVTVHDNDNHFETILRTNWLMATISFGLYWWHVAALHPCRLPERGQSGCKHCCCRLADMLPPFLADCKHAANMLSQHSCTAPHPHLKHAAILRNAPSCTCRRASLPMWLLWRLPNPPAPPCLFLQLPPPDWLWPGAVPVARGQHCPMTKAS